MKTTILKTVMISSLFLLITACLSEEGIGTGGGQGDEPSTSIGDTITTVNDISTDFSGSYDLKDDNCEIAPIESFTITQTSTSATMEITDAGDSDAESGDMASGEFVNEDNQDGIYFSAYDCIVFFIRNQTDIDEAEVIDDNVDYDIGDLAMICSDSSEIGSCILSYDENNSSSSNDDASFTVTSAK